MKKLLISLGILLVPLMAGAAYNDVSLGTSAIISINNSLGTAVSLTVSGSADVVESIVVGSDNFVATLQSGSTLKVASAGRNSILTTVSSANYSTTCETSQSTMTLTATAEIVITVTVSPNACGGAASTSSSNGGGGPIANFGGGGGGLATPATPAVPTVSPAVPATPVTMAQLQAMIASLTAQIAALGGTPSAGPGTSPMSFMSNTKLIVGSKGADVMNLQKFLNSDPDTRIASTGAGSPGKETTTFGLLTKKAIQKFQVKYGIAGPGKVGYGNFGPATRAKVAELSK